jgi:hypothetical protein
MRRREGRQSKRERESLPESREVFRGGRRRTPTPSLLSPFIPVSGEGNVVIKCKTEWGPLGDMFSPTKTIFLFSLFQLKLAYDPFWFHDHVTAYVTKKWPV